MADSPAAPKSSPVASTSSPVASDERPPTSDAHGPTSQPSAVQSRPEEPSIVVTVDPPDVAPNSGPVRSTPRRGGRRAPEATVVIRDRRPLAELSPPALSSPPSAWGRRLKTVLVWGLTGVVAFAAGAFVSDMTLESDADGSQPGADEYVVPKAEGADRAKAAP